MTLLQIDCPFLQISLIIINNKTIYFLFVYKRSKRDSCVRTVSKIALHDVSIFHQKEELRHKVIYTEGKKFSNIL